MSTKAFVEEVEKKQKAVVDAVQKCHKQYNLLESWMEQFGSYEDFKDDMEDLKASIEELQKVILVPVHVPAPTKLVQVLKHCATGGACSACPNAPCDIHGILNLAEEPNKEAIARVLLELLGEDVADGK